MRIADEVGCQVVVCAYETFAGCSVSMQAEFASVLTANATPDKIHANESNQSSNGTCPAKPKGKSLDSAPGYWLALAMAS